MACAAFRISCIKPPNWHGAVCCSCRHRRAPAWFHPRLHCLPVARWFSRASVPALPVAWWFSLASVPPCLLRGGSRPSSLRPSLSSVLRGTMLSARLFRGSHPLCTGGSNPLQHRPVLRWLVPAAALPLLLYRCCCTALLLPLPPASRLWTTLGLQTQTATATPTTARQRSRPRSWMASPTDLIHAHVFCMRQAH